jgi:hypothetical protein
MWKALQWRSTSHRADETVCLATILGSDPGPILDLPEEDYDGRMIKLLRIAEPLPLKPFFQLPPRLSQLGFRWAPASFLNGFRGIATNPFLVVNGRGEIGPNGEGLAFKSPGLILLPSEYPLPSIGTPFTVRVSSGTDEVLHFVLEYRFEQDKKAKNVDGTQNLNRPAFVTITPVSEKNHTGALVHVVEVDGETETIKAHFIAGISLTTKPKSSPNLSPSGSIFMAERPPPNQSWLIY